MAAISLQNVSKRFGEVNALQDINLEITSGEFVCLIGASGCGKTTLLRIIAGLETASAGAAFIDGSSPSNSRRKREIGIAFQRPALIPSRTALQNVELTLSITKRTGISTATELLTEFGLAQFLNYYPYQLSGGMQQRASIAASMIHDPKVLLLDEPFGALDELTREHMGEWLSQILAQRQKTVVFVTHSVEEAVFLADRIVVMSPMPGRLYELISVDFDKPRTRSLKTDSRFLDLVGLVRETLYAIEGIERSTSPWSEPTLPIS